MLKFSLKNKQQLDLILISLIGTKIEIINSNNKNEIGIIGVIIFETSNFLHINITGKIIKKINKNNLIIEFNQNNIKYNLNCNCLNNSLINRIKKFK